MLARNQAINRQYIGKNIRNFMELPDLIDIQLSSYQKFLKRGESSGDSDEEVGLEDVFRSTFPIESPNGDMLLEYEFYELDEENIKFSELECKQKGLTFAVPLKARINLIFQQTGEIRQKDIYMGDIPLMTDRGTFIINGAERVVVSQIHRSPGVIFSHEKGIYSSRIIPYRGSWLEFEIDQKKELIYAKIDRKKRILGTLFLRALGYETREDIIRCFYKVEKMKVSDDRAKRDKMVGRVLASAVFIKAEDGSQKKLYRAGEKLHPHNIDELVMNKVGEITVINFEAEGSLNSPWLSTASSARRFAIPARTRRATSPRRKTPSPPSTPSSCPASRSPSSPPRRTSSRCSSRAAATTSAASAAIS